MTMDGEPVVTGKIRFWPASGRPAGGEIGPDGQYELTTFEAGDGALVGEHVVTINALTTEGSVPKITSLEQEKEYYSNPGNRPVRAQQIKWIVPERYSHQGSSGLKATVESGENELNFSVTAGPHD